MYLKLCLCVYIITCEMIIFIKLAGSESDDNKSDDFQLVERRKTRQQSKFERSQKLDKMISCE